MWLDPAGFLLPLTLTRTTFHWFVPCPRENMGSPEHLVCFHCTTVRVPVRESDNDEEIITGISWIAVDVKSNQVKKILAVTCYGLCKLLCRGFPCPARAKKFLRALGAISSENNMTVVFFFANVFLIYAELAWFRAEMCCESGPVWSERSVKINHQLNCDQWGWTTRRSLRRGNVTTGICSILHFRCPLCSINNKTRNYRFCDKFLYSPSSLALSC